MLLKPFVLRRLKSEVQFKIPPKKEIYLYMGLSNLQKKLYKQILTKNIDIINCISKEKIQLLNILMQLKKVCNHPYLFPNIEEGPPFVTGEHLIENSMKMKVLDNLVNKIKLEKGSKVLIFSQMVTVINILDDYCRYRGYKFCRIDGSTSRESRDYQINLFQQSTIKHNKKISTDSNFNCNKFNEDSDDYFIFLLSTRSGGLGINLFAANYVVLYDSDWNPQVDLQAIDRAHRIGQTKELTIYRFVCEGTVEEKIVERAAKKLKIDHLIIQKGKIIQNKPSAIELNTMINHGVLDIFNTNTKTKLKDCYCSCHKNNVNICNLCVCNNTHIDITDMLKYSENKTIELNCKLRSLEDKMNITNLSLFTNNKDIYKFEGENYKNFLGDNNINNLVINSIGQRERKYLYTNLDNINNENNENANKRKPKTLTGWRSKVNNGGFDHQFFNVEELDKLDNKEKLWNEYLTILNKTGIKNSDNIKHDNDNCIRDINKKMLNNCPCEFTEKDEERRAQLLSEGFSNWSKKDFIKLYDALKIIPIQDSLQLSNFIKSKTVNEINLYVNTLMKNLNKIKFGSKILSRINTLKSENEKIQSYHNIIKKLYKEISYLSENIYNNCPESVDSYINNYYFYTRKSSKNIKANKTNSNFNNSIVINNDKNPVFDYNEDKYFLCLLFKYGYGNWNRIRYHILFDQKVQFNIDLITK